MSTKTLRWLGILFPVLFWASVIALRTYLAPYTTAVLEATIEVLLVAGAGALFSNWVATRFERHDAETINVCSRPRRCARQPSH